MLRRWAKHAGSRSLVRLFSVAQVEDGRERERSNTSRSRIWNNPGAVEMIKGTGFFLFVPPPQPFWLLSSFDKLEKAHLFQVCNCVGIDSSTCLSRWFAVLVDNRPDVRIQKSSLSLSPRHGGARELGLTFAFIFALFIISLYSKRFPAGMFSPLRTFPKVSYRHCRVEAWKVCIYDDFRWLAEKVASP